MRRSILVLLVAVSAGAAGCVVEIHRPLICSDMAACAAGDYCDFFEGRECGGPGVEGICVERPTACPLFYAPVCGCDGVTYGNECEAHAGGVDVADAAACELQPCRPHAALGIGSCDLFLGWVWDGADCVPISGCWCHGPDCDDATQAREECLERHTSCEAPATCGGLMGFMCGAEEWCDYPDDGMCGAADQTGVCRERPDACPAIEAPVCGCDGNTYGNSCAAHAAGVDVASAGPCEPDFCGGFAGFTCRSGEYCDTTEGSVCDAPGLCRPRPTICPDYADPSCGCDGVTYGNPCEANAAGTEVAHGGPCVTPA